MGNSVRAVRHAAIGLAVLCGAWALPARADTARGLDDFRNGRYSEAVSEWRQSADAGDGAAALYLGVLYDTGFGVPQSAAEALGWYRRGGERGNVTAMFNAAVMQDAGRGVAADPAAAVPLYERAAQAGSGRADYNLGLMFESGTGAPKDRQRAIGYYRQAAAHGVPEGKAHLERMGVQFAGVVGPSKPDPAMTNFQQAQRALLARGVDGDIRAATLFRKAAGGGDALAAYNLGYCYEHGIGVTASVDQAVQWYRRSAAGAHDATLREIASNGERNLLAGVSHVQR